MGTRGFVGFLVDGEEKIGYNHFDSYPSGVGLDVLTWLRGARLKDNLTDRARAVKVVTEDTPFTDDDLLNLARYTDTSVGDQGIHNEVVHDWYQLLRNTQGNPEAMLDAGYILDAHEFPLDSLFCEWGYLVNLDEQVLEVYTGFQSTPPTKGRWAGKKVDSSKPALSGSTYYAVEQIAAYPFNDLPTDQEFCKLEDED